MGKQKYFLILFSLICATAVCAGESDSFPNLNITVTGFESDVGQLGINIFRNDDEMFAHPYRVSFVKIEKQKAQLMINDLPFGEYALVAYHDRNSNEKLDHHWLGYPSEPIGYSSNFHFGLFSGMPTFKKLKFEYRQISQQLNIHINQ